MRVLLSLVCCWLCQVPTVESEEFSQELQVEAICATVRLNDPGRDVQGSGVIVAANERGIVCLELFIGLARSQPEWMARLLDCSPRRVASQALQASSRARHTPQAQHRRW